MYVIRQVLAVVQRQVGHGDAVRTLRMYASILLAERQYSRRSPRGVHITLLVEEGEEEEGGGEENLSPFGPQTLLPYTLPSTVSCPNFLLSCK